MLLCSCKGMSEVSHSHNLVLMLLLLLGVLLGKLMLVNHLSVLFRCELVLCMCHQLRGDKLLQFLDRELLVLLRKTLLFSKLLDRHLLLLLRNDLLLDQV